jgi:hypothetical protein
MTMGLLGGGALGEMYYPWGGGAAAGVISIIEANGIQA